MTKSPEPLARVKGARIVILGVNDDGEQGDATTQAAAHSAEEEQAVQPFATLAHSNGQTPDQRRRKRGVAGLAARHFSGLIQRLDGEVANGVIAKNGGARIVKVERA